MLRRRVLVATVVVLLVTVAAAGTASASDKSAAKQLVLTEKDVGAGYRASKSSSSSNGYEQIASCVGKSVAKRVVTARANGPDLTKRQDGSVITSSAEIVKTPAMAKTDRNVLSDPKFADCIAQAAKDQLASQGVTDVSSQRVDVKPYGSYSTAIETRVTGASNGQPLGLTVVQVGILKGRAELMVSFLTNGAVPFDQTNGQVILGRLNRRLAKTKT